MEKPTGRRASDVDVIVKYTRDLEAGFRSSGKGGGVELLAANKIATKTTFPVTNRKCNNQQRSETCKRTVTLIVCSQSVIYKRTSSNSQCHSATTSPSLLQ